MPKFRMPFFSGQSLLLSTTILNDKQFLKFKPMIDFMLLCLYKEAVVSPVASKYCDDFVECLNKIYALLSVQHHDIIRTLKYVYISLTFQSQCNMTFIHWQFPLI